MKYHFDKYKFSSEFSFKEIESATVKFYTDSFVVRILPFFHYSGNYFKHSIYNEDIEKTVYRTLRVEPDIFKVDLSSLSKFNEYYVGVYKNRRKIQIYKSNLDGIILKI